MAIKFDKSKVRLWKGTEKAGASTNIGIRFNAEKSESEIDTIYEEIKAVLTRKYGEGKE